MSTIEHENKYQINVRMVNKGEWKNNKKTGEGMFKFISGDTYQGNCRE
jgi:hypothetical protein